MILTFRSLERWPYPESRDRPSSPFRSSYRETLALLDRELLALNAAGPTLSVVAPAGQLRLDGMLRADARVLHPGVILSFETRSGPLSFPCDRYNARWNQPRNDAWHENLRAIALGLEALRKVDRYGITRHGEQYAGWRALPAAQDLDGMTVEQAQRFLRDHAGDTTEEDWSRVYRAAALRLHPDHGGDPALFRRLREAYDLVKGAP